MADKKLVYLGESYFSSSLENIRNIEIVPNWLAIRHLLITFSSRRSKKRLPITLIRESNEIIGPRLIAALADNGAKRNEISAP